MAPYCIMDTKGSFLFVFLLLFCIGFLFNPIHRIPSCNVFFIQTRLDSISIASANFTHTKTSQHFKNNGLYLDSFQLIKTSVVLNENKGTSCRMTIKYSSKMVILQKKVYKNTWRPTLGKTEFVVQAVSDITCLQR